MSSYNNAKFNNKCRSVYVGIELNSKSSVIADLSSVSTFLLGNSELQADVIKENIIKTNNLEMYFGGKFNNTRFNTTWVTRDLSISIKGISSLIDLESSISQNIKSISSLYLFAKKQSIFKTQENDRKFSGEFNSAKFNNIARVKYFSSQIKSTSKFQDLEDSITLNLKGKSYLKLLATSKNVVNLNSQDLSFSGEFNNTKFNTVYRLKELSTSLRSKSNFKDLEGNISQNLKGISKLYLSPTKDSFIKLGNLDRSFGESYNNTRFNTSHRIKDISIALKSISKLKDLENSVSQSIKSNSRLKAHVTKETVLDIHKLKKQLNISFNSAKFNTTYREKQIAIYLGGDSSFKDLESSIGVELKSTSNLNLVALSEKISNLQETNRRFSGSFNNTKFNIGDKIKYSLVSLRGNSSFNDIEGNTTVVLRGVSNLRATPTDQDNINIVNVSGLFGGSFNNYRFNVGDKEKYTSIYLKGQSQFKDVEGNVSIRLTGNSNLISSPNRERYPNISLKPMFKSTSALVLNAHLRISLGTLFKAKSSFKINANKYMWGNIVINSLSDIRLINFRVRFQNIRLQGRGSISFVTFVISVESLILNDLRFSPGDVIEIDLDNYYVTHNGVDITYKVLGNFFRFYAGLNTIKWTDNVNERNIKKDIQYQNKYL